MLDNLGELTSEDRSKYTQMMTSCYVDGYVGLMHRSPGGFGGLQAHDDYIGAVLNSPLIAHDVYEYGSRNFWIYNNESPSSKSLRSWFGRFPDFVAHIYRASGKKSPIFNELFDLVSIIFGNVNTSSTAVLKWCKFQTANSLLSKLAKKIFEKKINNKYGSMANMFAAEFGSDHPFVQYFLMTDKGV